MTYGARWLAVVVALAGAAGSTGASAQGDLDDVREEVRDEDAEPHATERADEGWLDAEVGLDAFDAGLAGTLFFPFTLPRALLGDTGGAARFERYPYRRGREVGGFWLGEDEGVAEWSLRPRWEIGSDFDDLERTGLGLELEHASRLGLDGAWSRWVEDVPGGSDELDLGDANVVWRFAQSPYVAFRAGLGMNVLDDSSGTELGINGTYAARFFPRRPFSAAAELDLGTLGDAELIHLRAELGVLLSRFELLAAWDHFDVDGEELRSVALGLRAWL